jgi:hypothetical protein
MALFGKKKVVVADVPVEARDSVIRTQGAPVPPVGVVDDEEQRAMIELVRSRVGLAGVFESPYPSSYAISLAVLDQLARLNVAVAKLEQTLKDLSKE